MWDRDWECELVQSSSQPTLEFDIRVALWILVSRCEDEMKGQLHMRFIYTLKEWLRWKKNSKTERNSISA